MTLDLLHAWLSLVTKIVLLGTTLYFWRLSRTQGVIIELAWGVIANAGGGNWTLETQEWQDAAHAWGVGAGFRREHPYDYEEEA